MYRKTDRKLSYLWQFPVSEGETMLNRFDTGLTWQGGLSDINSVPAVPVCRRSHTVSSALMTESENQFFNQGAAISLPFFDC